MIDSMVEFVCAALTLGCFARSNFSQSIQPFQTKSWFSTLLAAGWGPS